MHDAAPHRPTLSTGVRSAADVSDILRLLERKAEEYLDALFLEIDTPLSQDNARTFQLALMQDFIEVFNAARETRHVLPEDFKAEAV